jgi:hypothetical protein
MQYIKKQCFLSNTETENSRTYPHSVKIDTELVGATIEITHLITQATDYSNYKNNNMNDNPK